MADNAARDLQAAQEAVKAMMAPVEDNAESDDAPVENVQFETEGEIEVETEIEPTEDAEDGAEEETDEQPDLYTVKVNGEEIEVTFDELLSGYSRQSDYTRKSQDLAEQRKLVQQMEQEIAAERQQYSQLLPAMKQQLEQQMQAEPDWDKLYEKNPIEATRLEREWRKAKEQRQAQIQAVEAEQQRMTQIQQRQLNEQRQKQLQAEQERLQSLIPDWKKPEVAQKEAAEIRDFLIGKGFAEEDVNNITHAGVVALARNAMLFERGQRKISEAKSGNRQQGPKTIRAGSKGTQPQKRSAVKEAQTRLRQTGRVNDAAAVIKSLL